MRLLLVRHAVTVDTGRRLTGRLPVPLSPVGASAAESAARALAGSGIAAVVSSPVQRCRQTAAPIAAVAGVRVRVDRAFAEVDYGSWVGRRLPDLYRLAAWKRLMAMPSRFRFPDGETLEEVRQRAVVAIERLAAEHGDTTVAVVTHADVVRVLVCHHLGMPLDLVHRLQIAPVSLTEIVLEEGAVLVPRVSQVMVEP